MDGRETGMTGNRFVFANKIDDLYQDFTEPAAEGAVISRKALTSHDGSAEAENFTFGMHQLEDRFLVALIPNPLKPFTEKLFW